MIKKAETEQDIKDIAALADIIWHEHFTPLIGIEQVEYMLDKFQSEHAIKDAVTNDGYVYFMAIKDGELTGYIGARPEEDGMFLSKIYVSAACRRQGIASAMIRRAKDEFPDKKYMYLTVNRHNDIAVNTYRALGFKVWREQVTDIGGGFVMDDYVFKLDI